MRRRGEGEGKRGRKKKRPQPDFLATPLQPSATGKFFKRGPWFGIGWTALH